MSTHKLKTQARDGTPVVVVAGWEPSSRGFYLTIETGVCKLFERAPSGQGGPCRWDIDRMREVLDLYGIKVPRGMLEELVLDAQVSADAKSVDWAPDGTAVRVS